jgi:hypothetical protein
LDGTVCVTSADKGGIRTQLGFDDTRHRTMPSAPTGLRGLRFRGLAAGGTHCAAIVLERGDAEGTARQLMTWGGNMDGQLGHNVTTMRATPKQLKAKDFDHESIAQVEARRWIYFPPVNEMNELHCQAQRAL